MDLNRIQAINVERCVAPSPQGFGHTLDSWSHLEWAGAMCGEAGEASNVAKKLKRIDTGMSYANRDNDRDRPILIDKLGREYADTILYALLGLSKLGVRAEDILREVFNAKSDELGSDIKL